MPTSYQSTICFYHITKFCR